MAGLDLPGVPVPLKNIQQYLKTATEHEQRDPVVCYWARLYALQTGLKLSTKTSEETGFLLKLMDWLEATKKAHLDNEAITNEVAAQAHLENYALKLFLYADKNDREANFGKNVVKAFYTAGIIYDLLCTFGELGEEAAQNRKYSKWKAAYIHNCLKNGETPVPGPMKEEGDDESNLEPGPPGNVPSTSGLADEFEISEIELTDPDPKPAEDPEATEPEPTEPDSEPAEDPEITVPEPQEPDSEPAEDPEITEPEPQEPDSEPADQAKDEPQSEPEDESHASEPAGFVQPTPPPSTDAFGFPAIPNASNVNFPTPPVKPSQGNSPYPNIPNFNNTPASPGPSPHNPTPPPRSLPASQPVPFNPEDYNRKPMTEGGVVLDTEQIAKAQKYLKWVKSALDYDDVPTAVLNTQKVLHLLTTGEDPA